LFKVLLTLSCVKEFSESKKLKKETSSEKHEVYRHKLKVTSDLTNAEKNVSHDEYAKMLTQSVELYLISQKQQHLASSLKVEEASYKYSRDFYFGDEMSIKLYIVKIKSEEIIFDAEFINMIGDVNTYGRQKFSFSQQLGGLLSMT
jgi:acyl-CoA thioesterase FadM